MLSLSDPSRTPPKEGTALNTCMGGVLCNGVNAVKSTQVSQGFRAVSISRNTARLDQKGTRRYKVKEAAGPLIFSWQTAG